MFNTEGVFLSVSFPPMPLLNATESANASPGWWQLAQLTDESFDSIFSEKSFFPSSAFVWMEPLSYDKEKPAKQVNPASIKTGRRKFFMGIKILNPKGFSVSGCNFQHILSYG
jgi:hypothetical protein